MTEERAAARVEDDTGVDFDVACDVLVIGAGACGLIAGLRALEAGAQVIVVERDPVPSGSTGMSSGFVPAPATRFQAAQGIDDTVAKFARDVQAKAANGADDAIVDAVARSVGPALEWLADRHGLQWSVLDDFLYPGHSAHRMHAVPERTGAALMGRLLNAAQAAGLMLVCDSLVTTLYTGADDTITAVAISRPDGTTETISCRALVLACNGYGGNRELVARHIPEMAEAIYFGHQGNTGEALLWGAQLGAGVADLSAYQGHGSVAHPHGVLITWALLMAGAVQVNRNGERFSNEHGGYSEQSVKVLGQPDGIAYNIYDTRLHQMGLEFPDYVDAEKAGAIIRANDLDALAASLGVPADTLKATLNDVEGLCATGAIDRFGRDFADTPPLKPPYYAVRVTGVLFHTQGGLTINSTARVLREDGRPMANLFAGGGAARGISGSKVEGYLSGNGLASAVALGFIAGAEAAKSVSRL